MKQLLLCTAMFGLLTACGSVTQTTSNPSNAETLAAAQAKIPASFSSEVTAKMKEHNLKGFSLAIFENYEIVYSEQWGVKASTSPELINENTAFSTASMSKPVTALLSVILEEKGLIDLDAPVNDYLSRWKIPENEFTKQTPITWAHLLSHMSGASQFSGFSDFYEGDNIPTLTESLEGKLPRYNNIPIDFVFEAGSEWRYSGGGYTIVQMALEDHFKKPLHDLAHEYVFSPLDMTNTTMIQPNEAGFLTNIASVHDSKGDVIRSGIPITPQVAPSGMWSTPEDMIKLSVDLQKALKGEKGTRISQKSAQRVTDIITLKSSSGHSFFGPRSFGFDNVDWLIMGGSNTGVGGEVLASIENGSGIAFFGNGDRPNRTPVFTFARSKVLDMMQWGQPYEGAISTDIPEALSLAIKGTYKEFLYGEAPYLEILETDGQLYLSSGVFEYFLGQDKSEMVYLGDNTFKVMDYPNLLKFNLNSAGDFVSLDLLRNDDPSLTETLMIDDIKL